MYVSIGLQFYVWRWTIAARAYQLLLVGGRLIIHAPMVPRCELANPPIVELVLYSYLEVVMFSVFDNSVSVPKVRNSIMCYVTFLHWNFSLFDFIVTLTKNRLREKISIFLSKGSLVNSDFSLVLLLIILFMIILYRVNIIIQLTLTFYRNNTLRI